nr:MAG TPA: hypothetical protein [Caudoviricetes sp.]
MCFISAYINSQYPCMRGGLDPWNIRLSTLIL